MPRVIFKDITIEGFGSIATPLKFKFKDKGLTIIRGENGVGKTTIFSALYWVLYGKPSKEQASVETWPEVRPENFKGTMVSLRLTIEGEAFTVIRCSGYKPKIEGVKGGNRLIIQGGDDQPKDKRALQNWFIEKLNYSPDLFKNSVLFGQKLKRLISESGAKRKEIFEELTNVTFIRVAAEKAKLANKELLTLISNCEVGVIRLENNLEESESTLNSILSDIKDFEQDKADNIRNIREELTEEKENLDSILKSTISPDELGVLQKRALKLEAATKESPPYSLVELVASINATKRRIDKHRLAINSAETKQKSIKEQLKSLKSKICPVCGSDIDKAHRERHKHELATSFSKLDQTIGENNLAIETEKSNLNKLENKYKKTEQWGEANSKNKALYNEVSNMIERANTANERLGRCNARIDKLKAKLKAEKKKTLTISLDIEKQKSKLEELRKELKAEKLELRRLKLKQELYDWAIKGPLSNSGLKTILLKGIIEQINEEIKNYYQFVGFEVKFFIDEDSGRKDIHQYIYKNGVVKPYHDLSGGQGQLVDICTAFATEDVVSSINGCNVVLMDEVFESLSPNNIELVGDMINYKASRKFVTLITHHQSFNPQSANNLELEYDGEITSLKYS